MKGTSVQLKRSVVEIKNRRVQTCAPQKTDSGAHLKPGFFMRRVSEGCIHDLARRGWVSLPLGNPSECNAVVVEVPPSANSPAFRVRGWSVDVEDWNVPSTI